VFYENYIGSIIDWYAATLMRREPVITYDGPNEAGKQFFAAFSEIVTSGVRLSRTSFGSSWSKP